MFDQVNVHEHPAFADLRAGNLAGAAFLLQRHRMNVQERGGGLQIEGVDSAKCWTCVAKPLPTQVNRRDLFATVTHLAADGFPGLAIDRLLFRA